MRVVERTVLGCETALQLSSGAEQQLVDHNSRCDCGDYLRTARRCEGPVLVDTPNVVAGNDILLGKRQRRKSRRQSCRSHRTLVDTRQTQIEMHTFNAPMHPWWQLRQPGEHQVDRRVFIDDGRISVDQVAGVKDKAPVFKAQLGDQPVGQGRIGESQTGPPQIFEPQAYRRLAIGEGSRRCVEQVDGS